jgi:hypothetical protein
MGEAEKEEMMDGGGRGNNDNAYNSCYRGAMLGRRRGGKLGRSRKKRMMTFGQWQCGEWRGNDNQ